MRPLLYLLGASLALAPTALAGDEVAAILLLQGEVTVTGADGSRSGDVGMDLGRGDIVVVAEESAAILHLHNDWLVRVDEDLELAVSDIVLLDAPKTDRSIEAQLDDLLYPDERESMPDIDRAERVAGWHSRLTAAVAPPSTALDDDVLPAPSGFASEPERSGGGAGAMDVVEEIARAAKERRTRGKKRTKASKVEEQDNAPRPAPSAAPAPASAVAPVDTAPLLALVGQGDGRACIDEWLATLPVELTQLDFVLLNQDGVVTRVALEHGLSAPPCVRELLVGESVEGAVEPVRFSLPLTE